MIATAAPPPHRASADENDPRVLLGRAIAAQQAGKAGEAADLYERVIERVGPDPRLLSNIAAAYVSLGRFDDAIERYRLALERDARNGAIRLNLAFALFKAGRVRDAAGEAASVVASDPSNRSATLFLADCYRRRGLGDAGQLLDEYVLLEDAGPRLAQPDGARARAASRERGLRSTG